MSAEQLKTLSKVIKTAWKNLALADQADAEAVLEVLKTALAGLEDIEEAK